MLKLYSNIDTICMSDIENIYEKRYEKYKQTVLQYLQVILNY